MINNVVENGKDQTNLATKWLICEFVEFLNGPVVFRNVNIEASIAVIGRWSVHCHAGRTLHGCSDSGGGSVVPPAQVAAVGARSQETPQTTAPSTKEAQTRAQTCVHSQENAQRLQQKRHARRQRGIRVENRTAQSFLHHRLSETVIRNISSGVVF